MTDLQILLPWIDLVWVPIALILMEKGKRLLTAGFVLACAAILRLQVELLQSIGHPRGFFGLMDSTSFVRGQITYSVFIAFFLLIGWMSKGEMKVIHMAASITIFIAAFCVSSLIMVL